MTSKVDIWNMALDYVGEDDPVENEDENRPSANVCRRHWDRLLQEVIEARPWPFARQQRSLAEITDQSETTAYDDVVDTDKKRIPFAFAYRDPSQVAVVHIAAGGAETTLDADDDYTVTPPPAAGDEAEVVLDTGLSAGESVRITVSTSRVGWLHLYSLPSDCVVPRAVIIGQVRYELVPRDGRVPFSVLPNDAGDGRILACDLASGEFDTLEYTALITEPAAFSSHFVDALAWRLAVPLAAARVKDPKVVAWCQQQYHMALAKAAALERNIGHDMRAPSPTNLERDGSW